MARSFSAQEFLVIGLGRFGTSLAVELARSGCSVLGIDRDPDLVQHVSHELANVAALDATDESALRAIGPEEFDTAIVTTGDDFESSVLITVLLKELGVRTVICKAPDERQKRILLRVGADQVILPEHEAGVRLARHLTSPLLIDWLQLQPGMTVGQMRCPPVLAGRSLRELDLPGRIGVTVLLIKGERLLAAPKGHDVLQAEDELLVIGPDEGIRRLQEGNL